MDLYSAPINGLSNNVFRKLCLEFGADFVFTEMVWAERILCQNEFEEKKLQIDDERHTIIQIIAEDSQSFEPFLKILKKRFPQIKELNLNIGCPQSTLSKKMIGGGMLKNKEKMKEFCEEFSIACKKYRFVPSVKIRTGVSSPDIESYLNIIGKAGISKIYIHARTLTQGYVRPANYNTLKESEKKLTEFDVIVNGDIKNLKTLEKTVSSVKCTGAMIGRAALIDPSIFLKLKGKDSPSKKEIILRFLDYAKDLHMATIKKNISWMTQNIVHGGIIRSKINNAKTISELKKIIDGI